MRARRVLAPTLLPALLPSAALAQAKAGWGNVGQQEEPAFSWTQPMFGDFGWAGPPATRAFFCRLCAALARRGGLVGRRPGGAPRHGVLGLDTTRGDRLFITLLGSAYILLGWLALMSTPIWGGLALCAAWGAFVFIKV
jgi:predicted small integral membrane protein